MMTHLFTFPDSQKNYIKKVYRNFFENPNSQSIEFISDSDLFDRTPVFQQVRKNETKIVLTSSGTGVLRVISNALNLETHYTSVSYIGESAVNDPQFSYFNDNNQKTNVIIYKLAEQIHLSTGQIETPFDIRLGALRNNISTARCFLADSSFIFLNINALKYSDSPAQSGNNPSGLTSEEANQLTYMAGQSHKNKVLIIYGFDELNHDPENVSINSALQMLWYYQFGAHKNPQSWPLPPNQYQEFAIESRMTTENLVFRKDLLSGNWFHRLPFDLPTELDDFQWVATSHEEYLSAADDDIPVRLLEWYDIFDR